MKRISDLSQSVGAAFHYSHTGLIQVFGIASNTFDSPQPTYQSCTRLGMCSFGRVTETYRERMIYFFFPRHYSIVLKLMLIDIELKERIGYRLESCSERGLIVFLSSLCSEPPTTMLSP